MQLCEAFVKGEAASSHLQLSLAPYSERPISLQEMASYTPDCVFAIMSSYKEAIQAQRPAVHSCSPPSCLSRPQPHFAAIVAFLRSLPHFLDF